MMVCLKRGWKKRFAFKSLCSHLKNISLEKNSYSGNLYTASDVLRMKPTSESVTDSEEKPKLTLSIKTKLLFHF